MPTSRYQDALEQFELNGAAQDMKDFISPSVEWQFVSVSKNMTEALIEAYVAKDTVGQEFIEKTVYDLLMASYAFSLKFSSEVIRHTMTEARLVYFCSILLEQYVRQNGFPTYFDAHFWLLCYSFVEMLEGMPDYQSKQAMSRGVNESVFKSEEITEGLDYAEGLGEQAFSRYYPAAVQYLKDFPGEIDFVEESYVKRQEEN